MPKCLNWEVCINLINLLKTVCLTKLIKFCSGHNCGRFVWQLDEVSTGQANWKEVLRNFWPEFHEDVVDAMKVPISKVHPGIPSPWYSSTSYEFAWSWIVSDDFIVHFILNVKVAVLLEELLAKQLFPSTSAGAGDRVCPRLAYTWLYLLICCYMDGNSANIRRLLTSFRVFVASSISAVVSWENMLFFCCQSVDDWWRPQLKIFMCQLQRRKSVSKTESLRSWLFFWMFAPPWLPVCFPSNTQLQIIGP